MSQKVDIDSVKNSVLSKFPLLGVPMSNLKFKEEKHVPTACTDGQTVYYSPDFMNSLSYEEKTFVVAHEVMHVAFDHIKRSKGKDMELWNIATDAVINQILKEQKLNGIKDMVDIEDALNKSAEEVYDGLYEEKQKLLQNLAQQMNQQQNQQQGKSGQQGSQGGQGNQQNSQNSQNGQGGQNGNQQDQQSGQGQNGNQTSQNQSQQNGQSQGQGSQGGQNSQNHSGQSRGQQSAGGNGGSSGGNTKGRLVLDEDGNVQHSAHDHHDIWEKALKRMEKQEKKEEKRNKKNKDRDSNNKNPNENKQNAQDFEKEFSKQNQESQGQQGNQQNKQQDSTQQMGQYNDSLGELFQDKDLNDKQNGSEKGEETKPMPNSQEIEKAFAESIKQDQEGEEQKPEDRPEEVLSKEEIEKAFSQANKQKKEEMGKKIRERLASQAKQAGVGMGDRDGTFGEVGKQKAVVDWKKLLRRELEKEEDRWSYRRADAENGYSARIGSFEIDEKSVTEVMLDTSGSVSDVMLRNFLRQLKPLLKESRMFVGCFDHNFYGFTEIKSNRDIDTFRIRGGGGTSFNTAAQYFSGKKGVNKLVFTDGYDYFTLMDKKYKDIKWLVFGGNTDFRPSLGKVIQVDERKLMQNFEREMGM